MEHILRLENRRVPCDSLITFLKSPEPKIRARAAGALGKLQDSTCLGTLLKILNDPNPTVRLEAAFALGQLGDAQAEKPLIRRLNSEDDLDVKIRVVEALGKIGTEESFPVLVTLFKEKDAKLRAEAALSVGRMALRNLTNKSATDSLTQLLRDEDDQVRWKACYSLMRIGKNLDSKSLLSATNDRDARVRMFAVQALGELKELSYLEPLGRILRKDPDWRVRVKAANALANYPLTRVVTYLPLLDQNHHVRLSIIQALGNSALQDPEGFQQNSREFNLAKLQIEQV